MGKKNAVNCKVCGTANARRAVKCKRCGFPLGEREAPAAAPPPAPYQATATPPAEIERDSLENEEDDDVVVINSYERGTGAGAPRGLEVLGCLLGGHIGGAFVAIFLRPILENINPKYHGVAIVAILLGIVAVAHSSKFIVKAISEIDENKSCFISRTGYAKALKKDLDIYFKTSGKDASADDARKHIEAFSCGSEDCRKHGGPRLDKGCGDIAITYEPASNAADYKVLIWSDFASTCRICVTPRGIYPNTPRQCKEATGLQCP